MSEKRYVVRKDDDPQEPRYYVGSGYNQGKAVPYFYAGLTRKSTKLYKTKKGAQEGADRFGGRVGVVELPDGSGDPAWLGYVLEVEDSLAKQERKPAQEQGKGQEKKSDNVDAFDGKTEKKTAGAGERRVAEVDPFWDQFGRENKSDNVDAFDGAVAASTEPEGWRERQARIRREIAERRQRRREQRALKNEKAGEQTEEPERDWIAGQIGIEDALEEAEMADAADVMGAEE